MNEAMGASGLQSGHKPRARWSDGGRGFWMVWRREANGYDYVGVGLTLPDAFDSWKDRYTLKVPRG
jgi:hypothetical protein